MANNRDDFSIATKRLLAQRVGMHCSNPNCRKSTIGSNSNPSKVTNIGVAAHICAAAKGGPRYDEKMTSEERKSIQNGIWLCQSCAKLIDSDSNYYTKELLYRWKYISENIARLELNGTNFTANEHITHEFISHLNENYKDKWFSCENNKEGTTITWDYEITNNLCTLSKDSIILIAGYSSSGKSIYTQSIVRHNLKKGARILYFNLKESADTISQMILSSESVVKINSMRKALLSEDDWKRIAIAINLLNKGELLLEPYDIDKSMSEYILSAIKYSNSDMIVIDDFNALNLTDKDINSFMYKLRSLASKSQTNIFILVNIDKKPPRVDKTPIMSDYPINNLQRFCDIIQVLYNNNDEEIIPDESQKLVETELIILKNYTLTTPYFVKLLNLPEYCCLSLHQKCDNDENPNLFQNNNII